MVVKLAPAEEKLLNVTLNNPRIQGEFIEQIEAFIDNLRDEIADDKAILDLRISEITNSIDETPIAEIRKKENENVFRIFQVHFKNQEAVDLFAKQIKQKITDDTKFVWFPGGD